MSARGSAPRAGWLATLVVVATCETGGVSGRESTEDPSSGADDDVCAPLEGHEPVPWPLSPSTSDPGTALCPRPPARPPTSVDVDCERIARIERLGVEQRHGQGMLVHTRLLDSEGRALDEPYDACLALYDHTCTTPVDAAIVHSPASAYTIILVHTPSDAQESRYMAASLDDYLALRPAGERIGVWRWGDGVTQIVPVTHDRDLISRRLTTGLMPHPVKHQSFDLAVGSAQASLEALDPHTHFGVRNVMVLAPQADLGRQHTEFRPRMRLDVLDRRALPSATDSLADSPWRPLVTDASARLDRDLAGGRFTVAYCQSPDGGVMALRGSPAAELVLDPREALPEEQGQACVAADLLAPLAEPEYIEFLLSPPQRLAYDHRVFTKSKEPFEASMRTSESPSGAAAEVVVKLRGNNSLDCQRKSYSVNFAGHAPRRLIAGTATDEYFLIAMCLDDRYLNQFTGDQIMAKLGAFPLGFRLIELRLDGKSQGVYLLVEKPQDTLKTAYSRVRMVVRRATDIDGEQPELKHAVGSDDTELAAYETFLEQVEMRHGPPRLAWLDAHLDLDRYLRWVATMSALQIGDFVDEAYFVATESADTCGRPTHSFHVVGWDPDDLFAPCHHDGESALYDPHGLVYCAEARLDHAMFDEPAVYDRYVDQLSAVLDEIDLATFVATVRETKSQLLHYLESDDVRGAMTELLDEVPEAIDFDVMQAEIDRKAAWLESAYQARSIELRRRIADYRATQRPR